MLLFILGLLLTGLVVGALGRLAIPGPNPMTIGMTILVGVGGAFLGGLVGNLLFGRPGGLLLATLGAALIVWLIDRNRGSRVG
ncbi:MAG: GlsB/YeaQ/YmgE family stress response membrane protein [Acidimicrobiales bacterium]